MESRRTFLASVLAIPSALTLARVVDFDIIDTTAGAQLPPGDDGATATPGESIQRAEAVYHRTHRYAVAVEESRGPLVARLGSCYFKGATGDDEFTGTLVVHAWDGYPQWNRFDADSSVATYHNATRDDALTRDVWAWAKMQRDAWYAVNHARRALLLAAQRAAGAGLDSSNPYLSAGYASMTINGRDYLFGASARPQARDREVFWSILREGPLPHWSF